MKIADIEAALLELRLDRSKWARLTIGDIVRSVKKDADADESGLERYVAGEHMTSGNLRLSSWGTIGTGYLGPAFHRYFKAGQVLFGTRRPYLKKVALADFEGICANTTLVLEPRDERVLPELFPFILSAEPFLQHAIRKMRGSVNPYVNWSDLVDLEVLLPTLEEQRRIAALLWACEHASRAYEDATRSVETAVSAHSESLIWEPNRWPTRKLGDLLSVSQYGTSAQPREAGQTPILRMNNLVDGHMDTSSLRFVDLEDAELEGLLVKKGDLLFNRTNSIELVGKIARFDLNGPFVFASYLVRLRTKPTLMDSSFLNIDLNSNTGQRLIQALATKGVSQANINVTNLKGIAVPVPDLESQEAIVAQIQQFKGLNQMVDDHLKKVHELKARLKVSLVGGVL